MNKFLPYIIPILTLSLGIIYFFVDPNLSILCPKCPWWFLTGTYCPSCGIQRFLHFLLNGDFYKAFYVNPFLMLSFPYAILAVLGKWYNYKNKLDKLNYYLYHRTTLITYLALFFSWWIIRNIIGI